MPRPQTCSRCGEEVRYGTREGVTGWLHRGEVDHLPIFGQIFTPEMAAEASSVASPCRPSTRSRRSRCRAIRSRSMTFRRALG